MILNTPLYDDIRELRSLGAGDASPRYLGWLNDPQVTQYLEMRFAPPQSLEELRGFLAAMQDSPTELLLGIFLRRNGAHVGNIKLGPINRHHATAEIGLIIGEADEWGKGHGAAAISLVTDYAFSSLGIAKLTAGCYAPNIGSTKSFLKVGYVQEGLRAQQWLLPEGRCDGVLLGRTRDAWEAGAREGTTIGDGATGTHHEER